MRKLILFLVVLGIVVFFLFRKNDEGASFFKPPEKTQVQKTTSQQLSSANESMTQTQSQDVQIVEQKKEKFSAWLTEEAKSLNQLNVDTKEKDLELKKRVENFSEDEKKIVQQTALDSSKAATQRILATYLLVLDQSKESVQNLQTLAEKALPDLGPINAHSEAEIRRGQELAVRTMAVDELVKRAATDPEALETLRKMASSAESAEIRSYAQRRLKEIK